MKRCLEFLKNIKGFGEGVWIVKRIFKGLEKVFGVFKGCGGFIGAEGVHRSIQGARRIHF